MVRLRAHEIHHFHRLQQGEDEIEVKKKVLPYLRRSNKFYEEMAQFISTRNSLQCRSHHQKLEEKYTHVNKIIALYKGHFNKTLYKKHLEQLDTITHEKQIESLTRYTLHDKIMVDAEIQTDIKDIRCDLVVVNPNLIVVQNKRDPPVNQPMPYQHSPVYYPPPIYSPMEASQHTSPSMSPYGQMGFWNGYHPSRF